MMTAGANHGKWMMIDVTILKEYHVQSVFHNNQDVVDIKELILVTRKPTKTKKEPKNSKSF